MFKPLISYPQYTQVFISVQFSHSPDRVKLTCGLQMYSLFLTNVYFEIRYLNEHSSYIEGLGLHGILRTLVEVFRPSDCYKWNHRRTCHIVDVFSPNLAQRFILVLFSISVFLNYVVGGYSSHRLLQKHSNTNTCTTHTYLAKKQSPITSITVHHCLPAPVLSSTSLGQQLSVPVARAQLTDG